MKLDLVDKKILYELDKNARTSTARIARTLRQSRERINYRIKRFEEKGIIRKYVTLIDPVMLGYANYKLYYRFQNLSKELEQEIVKHFIDHDHVYWVASCQGNWDLTLTIFAENIQHFDKLLSEFYSRYGEYILDQEFNTTLSIGVCGKDWLVPEGREQKFTPIADQQLSLSIDKKDVELLRILANNARLSAMELSRKTGLTQRQVLYRMKELEEKKIIMKYTTSLNLEVLGKQFFKTNLNFSHMDEKTKKKLIEFYKSEPSVGFFVFCVGSWPTEIELICEDNTEYFAVIDRLRETFPELKSYETIIFPREYKFEWMPRCYKAGQ
jgi:DNA-binding Lrp family transcriptional regulator